MLTNLVEWDSRRVPTYQQEDLPDIRKIHTDKWIRWHENSIKWQLIL